jgi:predicted Zn-dependent protease
MRFPRLILLTLIVLTGGMCLWLAGAHLWAWYHYRAGASALERYHDQEALDHLETCLTVWSRSAPIHLLAARAARRTGAFDRARDHLEKCQALEGTASDESNLEDNLLSAAAGNLEEVERYLEAWVDQHPADGPLVWEALAAGYLRMYRIRDALAVLDRWLADQPDNVQAQALKGDVWRQVRSLRRAVPCYRRAVQLDPERVGARRWLVFCLMEIGQFQEAVSHLDALRRVNPDDPDLLVRLGRCQSKLGQTEAGRQVLGEVLQKHPGHGLALRSLGQLALMEKKPAEAEDWLRQAVRALPYDYASHYALLQALRQQGKRKAARAQSRITEKFKKRQERIGEIQTHDMSMRPHDPALHCELGKLLLSVGHPEVGRQWLYSALRLDADYAPAHAALARYFAGHGDAERAAFHREQANKGRKKGDRKSDLTVRP